jgi:hypothetical protein
VLLLAVNPWLPYRLRAVLFRPSQKATPTARLRRMPPTAEPVAMPPIAPLLRPLLLPPLFPLERVEVDVGEVEDVDTAIAVDEEVEEGV